MGNNILKASKTCEIVVMTTGGTIEKIYDEERGELENRQSLIKEKILDKLRLPGTTLKVLTLFNKDSLHITDQERQLIIDNIQNHIIAEIPVVILHGTDTMAQTAERYRQAHPIPLAPVVFTGAMSPMGFEGSDAVQNLAEALLAARLLEPGVYISFHNRIFPVPGAVKNHSLKTFEMKRD